MIYLFSLSVVVSAICAYDLAVKRYDSFVWDIPDHIRAAFNVARFYAEFPFLIIDDLKDAYSRPIRHTD